LKILMCQIKLKGKRSKGLFEVKKVAFISEKKPTKSGEEKWNVPSSRKNSSRIYEDG